MEQGKLAEHIRKRAVYPRLFHENPQHERVAGTGRQTAVFSVGGELVTTQETMVIREMEDVGALAVSISNGLLSMFARPIGLMAEIILPMDFTEESLRKLVGVLSEKCRELSMDLSAVDTRCEKAAALPIVTAFGVGERVSNPYGDGKAEKVDSQCVDRESERVDSQCADRESERVDSQCVDRESGRVRSQYDDGKADVVHTVGKTPEQFSIIMAGLCGAYGTKLLYREEKIREGFPTAFLKNAEEIFEDMSIAKAAAVMNGSCIYMRPGGPKGVFGALWDLSEDLKTGFRVEIEKIPLRQETIEFCEKKDVSPYEIDALGSVIGVTDTPGPVLERLLEQGIPAEVIGYLSAKKEKCLLGVKIAGEEREIRFLDSPR